MRTRSTYGRLLTQVLFAMCVGEPYCYSYLVSLDDPPALETRQTPPQEQVAIKVPAIARRSWLRETQR
jgi:hypothetical protein